MIPMHKRICCWPEHEWFVWFGFPGLQQTTWPKNHFGIPLSRHFCRPRAAVDGSLRVQLVPLQRPFRLIACGCSHGFQFVWASWLRRSRRRLTPSKPQAAVLTWSTLARCRSRSMTSIRLAAAGGQVVGSTENLEGSGRASSISNRIWA